MRSTHAYDEEQTSFSTNDDGDMTSAAEGEPSDLEQPARNSSSQAPDLIRVDDIRSDTEDLPTSADVTSSDVTAFDSIPFADDSATNTPSRSAQPAHPVVRGGIFLKPNKPRRNVEFDPLALLLDAALEGELDLVMRSARAVADPSQPNDEGITALHNAICAGHFDIVKFLVEFGCDVNSPDSDGWCVSRKRCSH